MTTIVPFRLRPPKIRHIRLDRHYHAVNLGDVAMMLEVDLRCGGHGKFRRRLRRALNDAQRQGAEWLMQVPKGDATIRRLARRAQK